MMREESGGDEGGIGRMVREESADDEAGIGRMMTGRNRGEE